jgi:hypothetical protein
MKATVAISLLGLAIASEAFGQAKKEQAMPDIYPLAEVKWKDGPVSRPASAKVTLLEGLFPMRLLLPDATPPVLFTRDFHACNPAGLKTVLSDFE